MSQAPEHGPSRSDDAPPPFLGTWKHVYIFVICYLAGLIGLFYVFSRAFAP